MSTYIYVIRNGRLYIYVMIKYTQLLDFCLQISSNQKNKLPTSFYLYFKQAKLYKINCIDT